MQQNIDRLLVGTQKKNMTDPVISDLQKLAKIDLGRLENFS
jgi:hypothetical protein